MTAKVYVITGTIGSYSDTEWWIVRAFPTRASAAAFVKALVAQAEAAAKHVDNREGCPRCREYKKCRFANIRLDSEGPWDGSYSEVPYYSVNALPFGEQP